MNKLTTFLEEMKKYSDHASCDDACAHRPDKDYWIKLIKLNEILLEACERIETDDEIKNLRGIVNAVEGRKEIARTAIEKCKEIIG